MNINNDKNRQETLVWLYKGSNLKRMKEYSAARMCFEKAHKLGSETGSICLAELYKDGLGGEKDVKKTSVLLFEPMKKKNVDAIMMMTQLYLNESSQFNIPKNKEIVFKLLKNVTQEKLNSKDPLCDTLLMLIARCYAVGMGTEQNDEKAMKYSLLSVS